MPIRVRKTAKNVDWGYEENNSSDSDWSGGGRGRSNRGNVTKTKRKKCRITSPSKKKRIAKYNTYRFTENAGELRQTDVLLGRGPNLCMHHGNVLFRFFCYLARPIYVDKLTSRNVKSDIASLIVKLMDALDPPGRFVEYDGDDDSTYFIVPEAKMLEKTCQALRENKMSYPPTFHDLLQRIKVTKSNATKADLIASATGIDLETFKDVHDAMDEISNKCELSIRFLECFVDSKGVSVPKTVRSSTTVSKTPKLFREGGTKKASVATKRTKTASGGSVRPPAKSSKTRVSKTPHMFREDRAEKASVAKKRKKATSGRSVLPKATSDEGLGKREVQAQASKPSKKRKADDTNENQTLVPPLKYPAKSPRHPNSYRVKGPPATSEPDRTEEPKRLATPGRASSVYRRQPLPLKSPRNHGISNPVQSRLDGADAARSAPVPDHEAFSTFPPPLTTFFSGIVSNGASAGSPAGLKYSQTRSPQAFLGSPSSPNKKSNFDGQSPSHASALPPNLTSLISGMCGPSHQEWLSAIVKNQECMSGATMDAPSLLPPQFTSFLSGMFGDKIDFKNMTSVEEALELLPPTLANRLSCTFLTPMQSSAFANAKPKEDQSPSGSVGGPNQESKMPSPASDTKIEKINVESDDAKPSAAAALLGLGKGVRRATLDPRIARFDQASPATVIEKDLGGVGGSSKSARSLLDDDGDEDLQDSKVQAARRLSFGVDLFHHNDQPL